MKRQTKLLGKIIFLTLLLQSCEEPLPVEGACTLPEDPGTTLDAKVADGDASEGTEATPLPECDVPPDDVPPDLDPEADLEINANLRDFSNAKEEKMLKALERLKIVINSVEFKERVLNHVYLGKKTFVNNNGLTNEEIYDEMMLGAEKLMPAEDGEMDVDITLYYSNNSTVGYTYPNTTRIWVNDKFFSGFTLGRVAANVTHEWTHKVGYGHDSSRTTRRPFSVPYGVGSIIQELVDGM